MKGTIFLTNDTSIDLNDDTYLAREETYGVVVSKKLPSGSSEITYPWHRIVSIVKNYTDE